MEKKPLTEGNVRGVIKGNEKPEQQQNVKPIAPPPPPKPAKQSGNTDKNE